MDEGYLGVFKHSYHSSLTLKKQFQIPNGSKILNIVKIDNNKFLISLFKEGLTICTINFNSYEVNATDKKFF